MVGRIVTLVLLALLALIHNQLWLGDGGVARAQALQAQIDAQQKANALVQQEVERLRSEVQDLKDRRGR